MRGPEPSQRRSLAILNSVTAAAFRPLCARTIRSSVPCAVNLFAAVMNGAPVIAAICAATWSPKPGRGVQPGADRGAAHGQLQQPGGGVLDLGDRVLQCPGVSGPFLPDGQRHRVLQVRPADLDHLRPLAGVAVHGVPQPAQRRDRLARRPSCRRRCASRSGSVSLEDWPMLTWSFGWTGCCVPERPAQPAGCTGWR